MNRILIQDLKRISPSTNSSKVASDHVLMVQSLQEICQIITSTHLFKILPPKVKMNVNAVSRRRDILIYSVLRRSVTTVHYTLTTFQTACCLRYNRYAEGVRFVISSDERKFNPCGNKGQCNKFLYKYVGFFFVSIIPPILDIHCFIYHQRYIFSTTDSVVK